MNVLWGLEMKSRLGLALCRQVSQGYATESTTLANPT